MVENLDETKKMGERALELYDKQYDYEIAMKKYQNVFLKLLEKWKDERKKSRNWLFKINMYDDGWYQCTILAGGVLNSTETSKLNFIIASGVSVFCRVAVNCFILITGYFISEDNSEIQIKKITIPIKKHYKKIWFYSVFIFASACLIDKSLFSVKGLINSITPIMSNQWWFMTVFIFLLCIKPFLGKLLFQLSEKELKILLLSIAFFDIIQSTLGHNGFSERGTGVLHCTFMLILGYGIHHLPCLKMKGKKAIFIYGSSCLLAGIIAFGEKA